MPDVKPSDAAKAFADAALQAGSGAAVVALQSAAVNAAKPGTQTSEFKAVVGGIALTSILAGLKVLSIIPGPWMVPAIALSAGISVGAYALGRSNVKVAAIQGAAAAATAAAYATAVPPSATGPTSVR